VALGAPHWVAPVFSGLIAGYLTYDMLHYATHHIPMRGRYGKFLRKYHMLHHFKTPDQRFGVSSPLWDRVFGTLPA
jgi:sterol desaturase/sphingolipid hydroxylase (fatty acid hydroxylase superfamily)